MDPEAAATFAAIVRSTGCHFFSSKISEPPGVSNFAQLRELEVEDLLACSCGAIFRNQARRVYIALREAPAAEPVPPMRPATANSPSSPRFEAQPAAEQAAPCSPRFMVQSDVHEEPPTISDYTAVIPEVTVVPVASDIGRGAEEGEIFQGEKDDGDDSRL